MPDRVWQFLLQWEGSTYENDPDDSGGPTKYGIDSRSHPGVDIRSLNEQSARAIYEKEWDDSPAALLGDDLGFVYFDSAVNCGRWEALKWLHRNFDCAAYLNAREQYYRNLCEEKPVFKKYLHGWLNRTEALRKAITK